MRTIISVALAICFAAPALGAAPVSMTCENPRQAYLVAFDGENLVLDPDTTAVRYTVLAVQDGGPIAGMVGQESGLGFAAYFRGDARIDFYSDDKIVQTDHCTAN